MLCLVSLLPPCCLWLCTFSLGIHSHFVTVAGHRISVKHMICPNQLFPYNWLHLLPWLLPYLKTLKLSTRVCVHTHTDALGTKINNGEEFLPIPLIFPIKFSLLQAFLESESWNNCTSAATWSVSVALLKIALYEQQKTSRKKNLRVRYPFSLGPVWDIVFQGWPWEHWGLWAPL